MSLRYPPEPEGVIRAAVLYHRDGRAVAPRDQGDLLAGWDSDVYDQEIAERCHALLRQERWAGQLADDRLQCRLFYSLRHRQPPWQRMLDTVGELLDYGPRYVFTGAGPSAKALLDRCNQVRREIHSLCGFVRLAAAPDGVLVARAPLAHNSGDLLALALSRRNPGQPLALITPRGNWFVSGGDVAPFAGLEYNQINDDQFHQAWLAYYRTQFIPQRNNPRHAARAIPQRYWQWLAEGEELAKNKTGIRRS